MSLDSVIKDLNKKIKEDVVTVGLPSYDYKKIQFTSPRMNYMTYGGLPIGKIIEFFGEEHGGKTTTALDIIANYQRMEDARKVIYIDAENNYQRGPFFMFVSVIPLLYDLISSITAYVRGFQEKQVYNFKNKHIQV